MLTPRLPRVPRVPRPRVEAIVIGGSAGSLSVLGEILPGLPSDFPPVLVVVHVLASSRSLLPDVFARRCAVRVRDADPFEAIERGSVYFAPPDYHLLVEPDRRCALSIAPPVHFSRPAIDVLFESAAAVFGAALAAVVLTGASVDGAQGLRAVDAAGGLALVQDPVGAESSVMPRAALTAVPSARVVPRTALLPLLRALGSTP